MNLDKVLSSGVIVSASFLIYLVLLVSFYAHFPNMYWIISALFIGFQAEHIFNFIGRSGNGFCRSITHTHWQKGLACITPAIVVALTWLLITSRSMFSS